MISKAEREELNTLSKEIFGVSSKWRTILDKGLTKQKMKKVVETVPGENGEPDTQREVEVPDLLPNGAKQSYVQRLSVEEVKNLLLDLKAKRDAMIAERKKVLDELKAKKEQEELASQLNSDAGGSAL